MRRYVEEHPKLVAAGVAGLVVFLALFGRAFMGGVRPEPLTRDELVDHSLSFVALEGWSSPNRLAWAYPVEGANAKEVAQAAAAAGVEAPDRETLNDPAWETFIISNPRSILPAVQAMRPPDPILSVASTPTGDIVRYLELSSSIAGQSIQRFQQSRELPFRALDVEHVFVVDANDQVPPTDADRERALTAAAGFFGRHEIVVTGAPSSIAVKNGRSDVRLVYLSWQAPGPAGTVDTTRLVVANDRVAAYDRMLRRPGVVPPQPRGGILSSFGAAIPIIVMILGSAFVAVMVVIRRRQGELDVRSATTVFLVYSGTTIVLFCMYFGLTGGIISAMGGNLEIWFGVANIIVTVPIIAVLTGLVVAGAWAAGEGQAYVVWPQHLLRPYSGFLRGRFRSAEAASPVASGYMIAFAALGVATLVGLVTPPSPEASVAPILALGYRPVAVSLPLQGLVFGLSITISAGIFAMTYVRARTRRMWLILLVGTVVAVGTRTNFTVQQFFPGSVVVASVVAVSLGVLMCVTFVRYGPVATSTAIYAYIVVIAAYPLVLTGNAGHAASGAWALGFALVPAAVAAYGVYRPVGQYGTSVPKHVRRALDRLRIGEEFAVARSVQARLLPESAPSVDGLDVAGICVPASEVGGDYFDYFRLSDDRLGVAIGDVSGKGVGAAIYMTLTKSYMVTQSSLEAEPVRVLGRVNEHLRRNLARGTFVTMVYAVVDAASGRLTYARAGHNPPVLVRPGGDGDLLSAPGIALGAAGRSMFESVTQVETIDLLAGDLVLFYTDGVTEAMNLNSEEFGEERLVHVVRDSAARGAAAAEVVDALLREVRTFAGRAPQHDDITIVAVRVVNGEQ